MNLAPDIQFDYSDELTMVQLVAAMQFVECGVPADLKKVAKGYQMA